MNLETKTTEELEAIIAQAEMIIRERYLDQEFEQQLLSQEYFSYESE